jgi:hypothetical protein
MSECTPSANEVSSSPATSSALPRLSRITGGDSGAYPSIGEIGATGWPSTTTTEEDASRRRVTNRTVGGQISRVLISRAAELIDSMETDDDVSLRLCLQDLASTISRMWEDADGCAQPHLDILATLERAVREAKGGCASPEQIRAFREAICDLSQSYLTPAHADVIRSRFLDVGFGSLSFLGAGSEELCE